MNIYTCLTGFIALLFVPLISQGQSTDQYCGTQLDDKTRQWLKDHQQKVAARSLKQPADTMVYIPIKFHLIGKDDSTDYLDKEILWQEICRLNSDFDTTNFLFYLYEDINYINNSTIYDVENNTEWAEMSTVVSNNMVSDAMNVFVPNSATGICGCYGCFGSDELTVVKLCMGPGSHTLAHEAGHYFGLPHPFQGWDDPNTREQVEQTDCYNRGDYFCDTPPDYVYERWTCPFDPVSWASSCNDCRSVDNDGDTINPDGKLIMSYANDGCQEYFSPEQRTTMRSFLYANRSNLLSHPMPDTSTISENLSSTLVNPQNYSDDIPVNCLDSIRMTWNRESGVDFYHLQVSQSVGFTDNSVDMLTKDTSLFVDTLTPNKTYYWRVKPLSRVNTCGSYTQYRFTTTDAVNININISVEEQPTENNSDGSALIWLVWGEGTSPYDYQWSNGDTDSLLDNVSAGTYTVTVYDKKRCKADTTITLDALSSIASTTPRNLKMYPNPVSEQRKSLNVKIEVPQGGQGSMRLYDNLGQEIIREKVALKAGLNHKEIHLPHQLPEGLYLFQLRYNDASLTRKIQVTQE